MLLWKIHSEFVQHFSRVSLESSEECPTPIYYNKAKLAVVGEQRREGLEQRVSLSGGPGSHRAPETAQLHQSQLTAIFFINELEEKQHTQEL